MSKEVVNSIKTESRKGNGGRRDEKRLSTKSQVRVHIRSHKPDLCQALQNLQPGLTIHRDPGSVSVERADWSHSGQVACCAGCWD
jgi:hypothetical protein